MSAGKKKLGIIFQQLLDLIDPIAMPPSKIGCFLPGNASAL